MSLHDKEHNKLPESIVKLEIIPSFMNLADGVNKDDVDVGNTGNLVHPEQFDVTPECNIPENLKTDREKKKFLRMRGLSYIGGTSNSQKIIEARKLGEPCKSVQCARIQKRHCNEFTEENRKEIFHKFWSVMDWSEKRSYVKQHVIVVEPSSRRNTSSKSRRQNTMQFYLNMNKKKLQVCKTMFASTLGLGDTFVREWVQKPPSYYKNKKNCPVNTTPTESNEVEDSIFDEDDSSFIEVSKQMEENSISNDQNIENSSKLSKNYSCLLVDQRKEIGKRCKPKFCHNNKCQQIDNEQRNVVYIQFWFEMNETEKLNYIHKNIEVIRTGPIEPNIMDTYYYFLKISKRRYPVCKKMFLSTLGLIEKDIEIICDDYKKSLLRNLNEPMEEDDSESDETKSDDNYNLSNKNDKSDDPLDVNVVYLDVDVDVHMEDENSDNDLENVEITENSENNILTNEKQLSNSDSEMNDDDTNSNSDQSSWKNDSANDDHSNDDHSNDDHSNDNIKIEKINKKPTRSSNRISTKIVKSKDSDEILENYDDKSLTKMKTTRRKTQQTNVQLSNGIIIPPQIGMTCNSTLCKNIPERSCDEITEELRQNIFKQFWCEISLNERKEYVKENIQKYTELKIQKYKYYLVISNERFQVCKRMFINTLCLHETCIENWLNNIENYDINLTNETDKKIKQPKRGIKQITMEKIQILDDFLDSIPKIPPKTFCTQRENKTYFNENVTGTKNLYHMYVQQMNDDNIELRLSKKTVVKRVILKNLTFYKGKKLRQGKIDNDVNVSETEKKYLKRCQQEKIHDKALARKSPTIVLLNIDSFNVKTSPNINGDDDNSTRLCCYNFTVCNMLTQHTMCYWFCETDASNSNNSSFITCLLDYFNNFCKNCQQIIIYGQVNDLRFKNIDMSNALLDYSIKNNKIIIQKFLPTNEKFETECDQIFRSIERKLKTFEIMLPSDYVAATIDARREPCEAKWMNFRVFKDFSLKSRKHRYYNLESSDGKIIDNFHAILYKNNGEVLYKIEFDDEWLIVPDNFKCIANEKIDWPQLYLERRKISAVKYQSLQSIKIQLPKDCHFFYDYLTIEI